MATPTCHRCGAIKDKTTGNCKTKSCFYRETCSFCGRLGHSANRCPQEFRKRQAERDARAAMRLQKQQEFEAKLTNMRCFKCGEKGHDRSRCPRFALPNFVYTEPQRDNASEETKNFGKMRMSQIAPQNSSVDADVETSLPDNADTASLRDLAGDSVDDEMSDSSKSELLDLERTPSLIVVSDEVAIPIVNASTFEQVEVDSLNAPKDTHVESWNLEEVLSRAPWKRPLDFSMLS